jgi:hypothetical protein
LDEVSQQELADLEAAWANDPSNPSNQAAHVRTLPPARELQSQPTVQGIALPVAATGTGFGLVTHIEVGTGTLITSTGRRLQLVPEEVLEVKRFVFTAALQAIVRETNNQLEELRISLGLPKIEPPKETLTEALNGDQAVQPVQGNEAPGSVLQVRPGRRRKASVLPPV